MNEKKEWSFDRSTGQMGFKAPEEKPENYQVCVQIMGRDVEFVQKKMYIEALDRAHRAEEQLDNFVFSIKNMRRHPKWYRFLIVGIITWLLVVLMIILSIVYTDALMWTAIIITIGFFLGLYVTCSNEHEFKLKLKSLETCGKLFCDGSKK